MNRKKCPYCGSIACIRKGVQQGHQRWKCRECNKKFQANKRVLPTKEELFCLYIFNKQTLTEIQDEYGVRTKDLQQLFDTIIVPEKKHTPRPVSLVVDATFFGDFGVIVFRDQKKKENLWWSFCTEEWTLYYERGKHELIRLGYEIISVTADGLPGLPSVFSGIPFQYCHFHAKKNITKYLTKNPKTDAGIELRQLMNSIQYHTQQSFEDALAVWSDTHKNFLNMKTYHPSGNWSYTHARLRSALRSMYRMRSYLFTYQQQPTFNIPHTTNSLEGFFAHLKIRIAVHRGVSKDRKKRIVEIVVYNSSVQYKKDMHKVIFRS